MQNEDKQNDTTKEHGSAWHNRLFDVAAENFPYPILLAATDVGQVLSLVPHPHQPALQVIHLGQIAGQIVVDEHQDLLGRARTGEQFEGVVSENYGGRCRLLVRPAEGRSTIGQ
jgi:hypothetical protein